jgi:hypothetical protein
MSLNYCKPYVIYKLAYYRTVYQEAYNSLLFCHLLIVIVVSRKLHSVWTYLVKVEVLRSKLTCAGGVPEPGDRVENDSRH